MTIAIIGGGAAGYFLAIAIKELNQSHSVTIYESGSKPLRKVKVSGGGRCNISNTFNNVKDLREVYPRGHKLLKRLFKSFSPADAQQWWEKHGVKLVAQEDECIFPVSQNSQTVIDSLTLYCKRYGVETIFDSKIESIMELKSKYDAVVLAIGGITKPSKIYEELESLGHEMSTPIPSLFTFSIEDESLRSLTGLVIEPAEMKIPGTKFRSSDALLLTHWGVSGPATLKLSSLSARFLAENDYKAALSINWLNKTLPETEKELESFINNNRKKEITTCPFPQLQNRLWQHLLRRSFGSGKELTTKDGYVLRYLDLSKKQINKLIETLSNDTYQIAGKYKHKDEFVTCGGVSLSSVNQNTLESKILPGLYFAGEVLDIDGVTGGFNFQACWTTAMTVAKALA
ncbi:MAG: aminoacetone oxidase family FAD-binding enzyme [Bacteroidaceae bacterium]|nr:aminoacetone oxidase family FAD-binding enzyme [Bacteroidaceae bacterium]